MGRKAKDLTGMEFGYLRVLCKSDKDSTSSHTFWWCRCTRCDSFISVRSDNLLSGRVVSCGCWRKNRWKTGK